MEKKLGWQHLTTQKIVDRWVSLLTPWRRHSRSATRFKSLKRQDWTNIQKPRSNFYNGRIPFSNTIPLHKSKATGFKKQNHTTLYFMTLLDTVLIGIGVFFSGEGLLTSKDLDLRCLLKAQVERVKSKTPNIPNVINAMFIWSCGRDSLLTPKASKRRRRKKKNTHTHKLVNHMTGHFWSTSYMVY